MGKKHFHKNKKHFNNYKKFNKNHSQNQNKTKQIKFFESIKETEIGITEYINKDVPGFTGVIKQRFSDFHVNEIDLEGNVVKLTDLKIPPTPQNEEEKDVKKEDVVLRLIEQNLITQEEFDSINQIISSKQDQNNKPVEIDVTSLSKEQRSTIHNILKSYFGSSLITNTFDRDDKKFIKCSKYTKNVRNDNRQKWPWAGEYVYFVVHKENIDSMKAAMMIANSLKCRPSAITYAGTKDKRAKTSQLFCMRRRYPNIISNSVKSIPNIHIGNFTFKTTTLKLGQLQGNRFRIALRNVTATDDIIEEAVNCLKANGFINYYGLQRFGNCASVPTYKIGEALMRGQWKEACELILKPRDNEPDFMKEMRDYWWKTRDAEGALKKLKWDKSVESKLLNGFFKCGDNDFVGALGNIPRNMRLLYIHSYQSLIWNRVVSRRIKEWGMTLHEGDLVFVDKEISDNTEQSTDFDDVNLENCEDDCEKEETTEEDENEKISQQKGLAKVLSKEDIDSGKYTIKDLVLPLPGHDILYPDNECLNWYNEYLNESELSSDKLKQKVKIYSLPGAYRKVLIVPENLNWTIKTYHSNNEDLIQSDLDEIKGNSKKSINTDELSETPMKAFIIEFNLPSSSYATMALRELLKIDTSTSNQIKLNKVNDESIKNDQGTKRQLDEADLKDSKKPKIDESSDCVKA